MTDISTLFPLEGEVTEEIISMCNPMNGARCQGALTLKKALGAFANGRNICWGVSGGMVDKLLITTEEKINFPRIDTPTKVTFIIHQ